jgi:exonuclease III
MASSINLISFNLHDFNQGIHVLGDLINDFNYPGIILVQEHCLTPDNIARLDCFEGYFVFATSAMPSAVETGPLYGRPFSGVGFIINESHRTYYKLVCSSERFIAVTLYDLLIINVYLPCDGTSDRISLYKSILDDVWQCREKFIDYKCVVAGDFNVDFSNMKSDTIFVTDFIADRKLFNCYDIHRGRKFVSYSNEALGHIGLLDYSSFLTLHRLLTLM